MTEQTIDTVHAERGRGPAWARGIGALGHPLVSGGLIGVVGGAAFLFGGIAGLPPASQGALRTLAAAVVVVALVAVLLLPRSLPEQVPPARAAVRVYGVSVAAMLLLLPATRLVAKAMDAPTAQIALVAVVVGGHFLPFASAFHAPVFRWIGGSMLVFGLLGAALAVAGMAEAGPAGAAAAGAAMLLIVAVQALRGTRRRS